jgi:hypothetical protein
MLYNASEANQCVRFPLGVDKLLQAPAEGLTSSDRVVMYTACDRTGCRGECCGANFFWATDHNVRCSRSFEPAGSQLEERRRSFIISAAKDNELLTEFATGKRNC